MADPVGGAVLGLAFAEFWSAVKEVSARVKDFKPKLRDLENTLGDLVPIIQDIERINTQLNESAHSEVERLKSIMEEGKELVSKCLDLSRWNIIKKSYYQKKLVELDRKIISFNNKHIELHVFMEVKHLRLQVSQLSNEVQSLRSCINPGGSAAAGSTVFSGTLPATYSSAKATHVVLAVTVERRTGWTGKKKAPAQNNHQDDDEIQNHNRWKSHPQQHTYAFKLYQELAKLKLGLGGGGGGDEAPERTVREAADRVLALTTEGTTMWSRAILAGRMKLRDHKKRRVANSLVVFRLQLLDKRLKKQRILAKLVPGCRKLPFPLVLEESIDYIAALEMQVRAMTTLANLLSHVTSSTSSSGTQVRPMTALANPLSDVTFSTSSSGTQVPAMTALDNILSDVTSSTSSSGTQVQAMTALASPLSNVTSSISFSGTQVQVMTALANLLSDVTSSASSETQVRAMTALANLLSDVASSTSSSGICLIHAVIPSQSFFPFRFP